MRAVPFTVAFVTVFLVVGVATGALFSSVTERPWFDAIATGLPAFREGRWWTILTSPFLLAPPYAYLLLLPLLVVGLGWAEWRFGALRTASIAVGGHVVGVLGAAGISALLESTGWAWGVQLAAERDVGPSCAAFACLVFAIATLPSPWRLRARVLTALWVGISLLYLGRLYDLEHAVALLAALAVAGALPAFRHPAGRPTEREWRLIAFWALLAIGAMQVIDLVVPYDGPLGANDPASTAGDVLLDVIVIALVANGVRRGYRLAWVGTLVLGAINVFLAGVVLALLPVLVENDLIEMPGDILGQAIVPAVFWLGLLIYLLLGRGAFRVPLRRSRRRLGAQPLTTPEMVDALHRLGGGTVSWMATWKDNARIVAGEGAVAVQTHAGVAIMLGDPIVPAGGHSQALEDFAARAQRAGLVPCAFSVGSVTEQAKPEGWRSVVVAEDTLVDLPGLAFTGKPWAHVRTAINRAEREGISYRLVRLADEPWNVIAQVRAISEQWSGDKGLPEMRFTLGTVEEALDPEVRVGIAVDAHGSLHGITSWLPVYSTQEPGRIAGWTLDLMRRRDGGFGPVMEFLIGSTARHFSEQGYDFLSLSGAPLVRSEDAGAGAIYQVLDAVAALVEPLYGFASLHRFKQKFQPRHEPMYLLYRDEGDLPRIGIGLLRAYLPDASFRQLAGAAGGTAAGAQAPPRATADADAPSAVTEATSSPVSRSFRHRLGAVLSGGGEIGGLLIQLALVILGVELLLAPEDELEILLILLWCVLATLYLAMTIVGLNVIARLDVPDPPFTRALIGHPLTRALSGLLTFGASALGLYEASVLIVNVGAERNDPMVEFAAIWTMLLSWAIFHWGYARIYYSRYRHADPPPLIFPRTPEPRLTDFVYFSFTNATTFSVSDVQVTTSRMRWTVVWHTCFAFFLNALIIALSMNVISKGDLFAGLGS